MRRAVQPGDVRALSSSSREGWEHSWLWRPLDILTFDRLSRLQTLQHLDRVAAPAVLLLIDAQKIIQALRRELILPEHVLGHARVIERHVVVRPVVDHELHDRTRGAIVSRVGDRMSDVEHDARRLVAVGWWQGIDETSGAVDVAGKRE